jgi:hypothetical protein
MGRPSNPPVRMIVLPLPAELAAAQAEASDEECMPPR